VGLPYWLGVSCRLGPSETLVGFDFPLVPLGSCLAALLPSHAAAVAVMHSPLAAVVPALHELREQWPGALGAYPEIGDGSAPPSVSAFELASHARAWLAAGARIIGGCCGTTPAHVRALARLQTGSGIGPTSFGT
jgi:S-methylmethionine-dependent homocysteine/selenocysteine methylase